MHVSYKNQQILGDTTEHIVAQSLFTYVLWK